MEAILRLSEKVKPVLTLPIRQLCGSAFLTYEQAWGRKVQEQFKKDIDVIGKIITNIKVLTSEEKGCQSSIIVTGNTMPTEVEKKLGYRSNIVLKISFPLRDARCNGLEVEEQIYRIVTSMLLENNHTPCLVRYLGTATTSSYKTLKLPSKYNSMIETFISNSEKVIYKEKPPTILCIEMSHGKTLYEWLDDSSIDERDVMSVIFQLFYTLNCFNRINMYHNDLHTKNIFVEEKPFPIIMYFKILEGYVRLITRYVPKIYDYVNSSIFYRGVDRNVDLDIFFCSEYTMCNFPPPRRDSYLLLLGFYTETIGKTYHKNLVKNFFEKVTEYKWFEKKAKQSKMRVFRLEDEPKIKDFDDIFRTLLQYPNIDLSYFENIPSDVPENLRFSLPRKSRVSLELVNVKVDFLPESKAKPVYDTDYSQIEDLLKTWYDELKPYKNWREDAFTTISDILMNEDKKLSSQLPYIVMILLSPAFYDLLYATREKIFGKEILGNVYYAFSLMGNKLPVKIYLYVNRYKN